LAPVTVKAFRVKKGRLIALAALAALLFFLGRALAENSSRQAVAVMAPALANKVIVVDPGHGGVDPGAVGKSGALEKDICLAVARRLADDLAQAGAMVLMTREADTDLSDPDTAGLAAKKREDLKRRVALANENRADLYVSIHVNSYPDPGRHGAQCFVQRGSAESKKAARHIQSELARVLGNTDREPLEADHYITRNTSAPAVIVEIGFITNKTEEELMQEPGYQGKLAWALYAGTVRYFSEEPEAAREPADKERVIKTFKEKSPGVINEP